MRARYDDDVPAPKAAPAAPAPAAEPEPIKTEPESSTGLDRAQHGAEDGASGWQEPQMQQQFKQEDMDQSGYNGGGDQSYGNAPMEEDNYGPINVKEDG